VLFAGHRRASPSDPKASEYTDPSPTLTLNPSNLRHAKWYSACPLPLTNPGSHALRRQHISVSMGAIDVKHRPLIGKLRSNQRKTHFAFTQRSSGLLNSLFSQARARYPPRLIIFKW